ncbi:MAG: hypothetical protein EP297_04145 [Gammaproteobacteria bacterium]|nr:MAG: hypothetical protein EP297_04145 [Gammaproteobacteria bacterium]
MNKILRYGLQVINYTIFMSIVWYFSIKPPYHQLQEDQGVVTLAFAHAAQIREPCRKLTPEEMAKLPPNMRLSMDCPRERSPVTVELYLDDELVTREVIEAPGFHKDQGIDLFQRFKVTAGEHQLRVWMNDDVNIEGPTYQHEQVITLKPEQQVLIDFDSGSGGFVVN